MGFNTVAVLYNDFTADLERDGSYGARMAEAMRRWPDHRRDPHVASFGAGMVISQAHADYSQVVIVGRNTGQRADAATDVDTFALRQMADCLERHGWKVTKPRPLARRAKALAALARMDGETLD